MAQRKGDCIIVIFGELGNFRTLKKRHLWQSSLYCHACNVPIEFVAIDKTDNTSTCEVSSVVCPALPGAGIEHLLDEPVEVLARLLVGGAHLYPDREHRAGRVGASVEPRHIVPVLGSVHLNSALPAPGNLEEKTKCVN